MRHVSATQAVMYGLVKTAQMAKSAGSERSGERWNTVPGSTALSEDTHNPGHYMLTRNYGPTGEMENFYLKLTPEQRDTGNFSRKDVLGHVGSHPMGQDRWEINSLYVEPQHRRKGIADALVGYHVNKVHPNKQMVVLTDPDKEGNVAKNYLTKLYAKHGFSGELRDIMPGAMHRPASGDLAKIAEMVVGRTESGRATANRETSVGGSVLYEDSHSPGYYMLAHRSPENESLTAYLKLSPEQAATKDFDTSNLIGYASSQPIATGHREINSLYVDPAHRRKGIAHTLLGFHKNLHSGESLHVIPDPFKDRSVSRENIEKLYAKHGFVPHENNPRAMYFPAQTKTAAAQASSQNNTNKKYIVPALGAAGAAALGYGIHRTAPYYKAKADNLGTWVQALDNTSPDLHILNGVHSATDPDVGPRVMRMVNDPFKKGKTVHGDARVRSNIHSRKPSFSAEIANSGHLDSAGRKAPFVAAGSLPTKDLESWGETLKAKMHEDAAAFGRTLDPNDVNSAVDAIVDAHRKNPFRRAAAFAEDAVDHLKNNKTKYLIGGALAAGAAFGGKKLYDRYKQRNTQGQ